MDSPAIRATPRQIIWRPCAYTARRRCTAIHSRLCVTPAAGPSELPKARCRSNCKQPSSHTDVHWHFELLCVKPRNNIDLQKGAVPFTRTAEPKFVLSWFEAKSELATFPHSTRGNARPFRRIRYIPQRGCVFGSSKYLHEHALSTANHVNSATDRCIRLGLLNFNYFVRTPQASLSFVCHLAFRTGGHGIQRTAKEDCKDHPFGKHRLLSS